jgi:hypothetical protein
MTVNSTTNRVVYTGNGVTTALSFPYYFLADADLVVVDRVTATGVETTKALTTDYTITGAGDPAGGTVTMLVAPATGHKTIIYRDPAATQGLDLVENDPLPAEDVEEAFDRAAMIDQRLKDRVDRAVRLSDGFNATFDPTLPALPTANAALAFNSTGTGFVVGPTTADISAAATNAADAAADAAAAETARAAAVVAQGLAETASTAAQAAAAGITWKNSVVCATTANVTLSGEQTIDGVLTSASRILVKNQSTASQNGVYVTGSGAWTRATDFDSWSEFVSAAVFVSTGSVAADKAYICTVDAGGTLGSTSITWSGLGAALLDSSVSTAALADGAVTLVKMATAAKTETIGIACSDETTALTSGTSKAVFRMPYAFTATAVRASLSTAQTSGSIFTVDINESGTSIISTKLTIDNTEKTSTTAATAAVISDFVLADDAEITIDIDQVGDGTAKGLKVYIIGYPT